jgi:hypothetical protein
MHRKGCAWSAVAHQGAAQRTMSENSASVAKALTASTLTVFCSRRLPGAEEELGAAVEDAGDVVVVVEAVGEAVEEAVEEGVEEGDVVVVGLGAVVVVGAAAGLEVVGVAAGLEVVGVGVGVVEGLGTVVVVGVGAGVAVLGVVVAAGASASGSSASSETWGQLLAGLAGPC